MVDYQITGVNKASSLWEARQFRCIVLAQDVPILWQYRCVALVTSSDTRRVDVRFPGIFASWRSILQKADHPHCEGRAAKSVGI